MTSEPNVKDRGLAAGHLLPWEDVNDYEELTSEYFQEYDPKTPTERSLVERLRDIHWKRNRIRLADRSMHLSELREHLSLSDGTAIHQATMVVCRRPFIQLGVHDALCSDDERDRFKIEDLKNESLGIEKAIAILEVDRTEEGLRHALDFTSGRILDAWKTRSDEIGIGDNLEEFANAFAEFLVTTVRPQLDSFVNTAEHRQETRLQAWGQSMNPINQFRIASLESELDRQYERCLRVLSKRQGQRTETDS